METKIHKRSLNSSTTAENIRQTIEHISKSFLND